MAAVVALGFLAGFRPSMGQELALLALIPVVGSTRTWGRLVVTLTAGAASVGLWLVPLAIEQPGGLSTWIQATRIETIGAERSTSVLDHAAGGPGNLGTFAAYTVLALGPLALLTLVAVSYTHLLVEQPVLQPGLAQAGRHVPAADGRSDG